jgi:hypothetical protein
VHAVLVGSVVVIALAELYPSVTGPLVGALQPLLVALGPTAWPTLLAALGTALVAVVAARTEPAAAALALGALAVVTLGRTALQFEDVLTGRVAATLWLWVRLLGAAVVAVVAGQLARRARRAGAPQ